MSISSVVVIAITHIFVVVRFYFIFHIRDNDKSTIYTSIDDNNNNDDGYNKKNKRRL